MKVMDRLFARYADPFSLLSGYIQTARFCEFLSSFTEFVADADLWDVYLHKVWDKSYQEFREMTSTAQDATALSEVDTEAIVKKSLEILGNFNPDVGVGEA